MTEAEVVERVAAQTELEPEAVERVLEAAGETVRETAGAQAAEGGGRGGGRAASFALALAVLLDHGERDAEGLAQLLAATAHAWDRQGHRVEELIEALTPEQLELPTPAALLQARRNVEARSGLLREFGALDSAQVAELAGSRATNRAALANRWRAEQRVIAVPLRDELLYPGFQFTGEGKPHTAVGAALAELLSDTQMSDWQAALWFIAPSGWLGGRRPADLLDEDADAVVEAARREAHERVF